VLDDALQECSHWQQHGDSLSIAVNVSAPSLQHLEFTDQILACIRRHDVPGKSIILEVTESEIMENLALVLQLIRALRAADVCFSVDDFGTGYSSLAQLQQLPVSELKIDRSFLRDIDRSVKGAAIVQAVVQLGHSLGLKVVAEGIETESVWQVVQRMDCDIAQGYFLDQADARRSIPCMA
jgi:EAL domain-containing protein (putative c-di-GMP-specific phosphodiesterase class I)